MTLPLSHSADPATSHEAEAKYRKSGKLKGDRARVLALVVRWPGKTCQEYFKLCVRNYGAGMIMGHRIQPRKESFTEIIWFALLRETIKKRMHDLYERNLVERRRDYATKGCPQFKRGGALIYWPTEAGVLVSQPTKAGVQMVLDRIVSA